MRRPAFNQVTAVWLVFLLLIPASRVVSTDFPSVDQLENVLTLGLFLAVIAFGQGLVILTGGVDLTVPAVVTASAFVVAAYTSSGGSVVVGVVLALGLSACIGLISGIGISYLRVPPFIMTLALSTIVASALLGLNKGTPSRPSPKVLVDLFSGRQDLLGIPTPVLIFFLVGALGWALQTVTTYGRRVYAVGAGETPSRIAGIRVAVVHTSVFVVAAVAYGIAGIMLLGFGAGVQLTLGNEWLLPSIAAVLVGGTSIRSGRGSYLGTLGGVLLLTTVGTDITASGLAEGWKQVLYGSIVLGALVLPRLQQLRTTAPHHPTPLAPGGAAPH